MQLDKQTAARQLIHAAIRNVSNEDDPLAAHVLIVGALDLIRQYAAKKDLQLKSDFLARLPPGVAREAINGLASKILCGIRIEIQTVRSTFQR